jgi:hypothetical protein
VVEHQRGTRLGMNDLFWVPGLVGLFVVVGVAVVYYFEGSCRIFDCIEQVPYNNVPYALIFLGIFVGLLEKVWPGPKRRPPAS